LFKDQKIADFLETLSSDTPTPGGGTAAALTGALAASLVSMVASLSTGKKKYEGYESLYEETIGKMKQMSEKLQDDMDNDASAFNGVMKALKMSKKTPEEKKARKAALQKSMKKAADSPLKIAECVVKVAVYAKEMVKYGNKNAVSDAYCALELSKASFNMAKENIDINLSSIKDKEYCAKVEGRVEELKTQLKNTMKELEE